MIKSASSAAIENGSRCLSSFLPGYLVQSTTFFWKWKKTFHSLFCVSLFFFRWLFLSFSMSWWQLDVIIMIFPWNSLRSHSFLLFIIFHSSLFSSSYSSSRDSENTHWTSSVDKRHRSNTLLWLELIKSTSSFKVSIWKFLTNKIWIQIWKVRYFDIHKIKSINFPYLIRNEMKMIKFGDIYTKRINFSFSSSFPFHSLTNSWYCVIL